MYTQYGEKADFLTIYIAEAHASDEWSMLDTRNATDNGRFDVPLARTIEDRLKLANDWVAWLSEWLNKTGKESVPYAVDPMDDNARLAYGAWPERLVVIENGTVEYYGAMGPFGYKPEEVRQWLAARFPGRQ